MSAITAGLVAQALVAACSEMGVDPVAVFETGQGRKARQLAGAALKACTGTTARSLAPLLKLSNPELSPSLLARAGVTTDMLLNVVEAMGGPGQVAEVSQVEATAPPADRQAAVEILRPAPAKAAPAAKAERKPRAAKADPAPCADPVEVPARPAVRAPVVRRGGAGWKARSAKPAPKPTVQKAVTRLKPVTASVSRWAGQFVRADWDLDEVADLFDVHPDALADALEFGVTA